MNVIEISDGTYRAMRALFSQCHPDRAWGLTATTEGQAYRIAENVFVRIRDFGTGVAEVQGVFRAPGRPAGAQLSACASVVQLCRELGYKRVILDCFEPVHHLWKAAGFEVYHREPFDLAHAPAAWLHKYGKPAVLYLQLNLEG